MQSTRLLQRFCASPMQYQMMASTQFLIPQTHRYFGANEKMLKTRMKSVNNIRKITKAMKMISSMKMKGELRRLQAGRDFGISAVDMMFKTDHYMTRRMVDTPANPKELIVPISSDKGLCGGINSGIVRDVKEYMHSRDSSKMEIFCIGEKATAALARNFKDQLRMSISDISTPYNYPTVMALSEHLIQAS
jgi:F-type H+-transporting ATPase subunit gamma